MTTLHPAHTHPPNPRTIPTFAVISGAQVQHVLTGHAHRIVDLIETTYRLHDNGETTNPPSYFLHLPDRPTSRIIALPASLGGTTPIDGLKWISSFPTNIEAGIPRASAVLILNDHDTGYPFACLESSIISATRTAASATLAADHLTRTRPRPRTIGFFGTGLIARYIHTFLTETGWHFDQIGIHDLSPDSAAGFRLYAEQAGTTPWVTIHNDPEELIRTSDLIVFATIANQPHITNPTWFDHHPLILHVSLRDLTPDILLTAANFLDDIDHCLTANTSPHLTEQRTGTRDFINGTLNDVINARVKVPTDQTVVFSPFGLGVLDLALGKYVYDEVARSDALHVVDDFFHELRRYG